MKGLPVRNLAFIVCLLTLPSTGLTLPWDKDMQDQPSLKPQEMLVAVNNSSVPVSGKDRFSPPADIIELVRARLDAGRTLANPIATSPDSIARGKAMYERHCLLCHGEQGHGDGTVGLKFVPQPMELNLDYVQLQPDGQIYYTISHGSIAMPAYWQAISPDDRWHLVNFIKEVFGET